MSECGSVRVLSVLQSESPPCPISTTTLVRLLLVVCLLPLLGLSSCESKAGSRGPVSAPATPALPQRCLGPFYPPAHHLLRLFPPPGIPLSPPSWRRQCLLILKVPTHITSSRKPSLTSPFSQIPHYVCPWHRACPCQRCMHFVACLVMSACLPH